MITQLAHSWSLKHIDWWYPEIYGSVFFPESNKVFEQVGSWKYKWHRNLNLVLSGLFLEENTITAVISFFSNNDYRNGTHYIVIKREESF